ncbi:MAG: hypothetical protein GPOALKHO_000820 [Sodalis sp.]|nr:MAG: hypothetical protein GPOALKHO_000820 [Sodalis sp.]
MTFCRQQLHHHPADIVNKAHTQHAIDLIQHQIPHEKDRPRAAEPALTCASGSPTSISTPLRSFIISELMLIPPNTTSEYMSIGENIIEYIMGGLLLNRRRFEIVLLRDSPAPLMRTKFRSGDNWMEGQTLPW